jgi:hypothetical protein
MVDRASRCGPAGGSPVRDEGHVHVCRPHAFRSVGLGRGQHGLVSKISGRSDLRVRTSSVAARSARHPRSYRVRHRRSDWSCGPRPPQERRGLCKKRLTQGCGSTLEKSKTIEDVTTRRDFVCARKHSVGSGRVSSFPTRYPAPSESNHARPPHAGPLDRHDLESRSAALDM